MLGIKTTDRDIDEMIEEVDGDLTGHITYTGNIAQDIVYFYNPLYILSNDWSDTVTCGLFTEDYLTFPFMKNCATVSSTIQLKTICL